MIPLLQNLLKLRKKPFLTFEQVNSLILIRFDQTYSFDRKKEQNMHKFNSRIRFEEWKNRPEIDCIEAIFSFN